MKILSLHSGKEVRASDLVLTNVGLLIGHVWNTPFTIQGLKEIRNMVEIDLKAWVAKDLTQNLSIPIKPLPPFMIQILNDGGLVPHF